MTVNFLPRGSRVPAGIFLRVVGCVMESWTLTCGSGLTKCLLQFLWGPEAMSGLVCIIKSLEIRAKTRTQFMTSKVLWACCLHGNELVVFAVLDLQNQCRVDTRIWSPSETLVSFQFLSGQSCVMFANPIIQRSWFQMVCFTQESLKVLLALCPIFLLSKVI